MTSLVLAQSLVREIGGNEGSVKERVRRAANRLQAFRFTRVLDFYHANPRCRVAYDEIVELERVAKLHKNELTEARDEFRQFEERLARIEQALRIQDQDFHRDSASALRIARGGVDRAVDKGDLD